MKEAPYAKHLLLGLLVFIMGTIGDWGSLQTLVKAQEKGNTKNFQNTKEMYRIIKSAAEEGGKKLEALKSFLFEQGDAKNKKVLLNQQEEGTEFSSPYNQFLFEAIVDPYFSETLELLKELDEQFDYDVESNPKNPSTSSLGADDPRLGGTMTSIFSQAVDSFAAVPDLGIPKVPCPPGAEDVATGTMERLGELQRDDSMGMPMPRPLAVPKVLGEFPLEPIIRFIQENPVRNGEKNGEHLTWGRDDVEEDFMPGERENRDGHLTTAEAKELNQLMNLPERSLKKKDRKRLEQLRMKLMNLS